MNIEQLTENAKIVLLLCGRFSTNDNDGLKQLSPREFDELILWLEKRSLGLEDLLNEANFKMFNESSSPIPLARIKTLLTRGASMALAIEKWTNKGLWVLCFGDQSYPQRLKQHLKHNAPPILYGAGDHELLSHGGLAVVGSRYVDPKGQKFAHEVGRKAAESNMQLISGAAKGVDEMAMHSAFSSGGSVIGVLADSLLKFAVSGKYRKGIQNGQLLLISTYNPEVGFTVGAAMGRNKYIYALADYAVVVNSAYMEGGTWAGASEELRREDPRPIFIRTGTGVPKGNIELLKIGGKPFPNEAFEGNFEEVLRTMVTSGTPIQTVGKTPERIPLIAEHTVSELIDTSLPNKEQLVTPEKCVDIPLTVFEAVKPLILQSLEKPMKLDDLAKLLNVRKPQLQDWVKRLTEEGKVEKRKIGKSKKLAIKRQIEELNFS